MRHKEIFVRIQGGVIVIRGVPRNTTFFHDHIFNTSKTGMKFPQNNEILPTNGSYWMVLK